MRSEADAVTFRNTARIKLDAGRSFFKISTAIDSKDIFCYTIGKSIEY